MCVYLVVNALAFDINEICGSCLTIAAWVIAKALQGSPSQGHQSQQSQMSVSQVTKKATPLKNSLKLYWPQRMKPHERSPTSLSLLLATDRQERLSDLTSYLCVKRENIRLHADKI